MATMSPDGSRMMFTRSTHAPEKAGKLLLDEASVNNTTIYFMLKGTEKWETILEIGLSDEQNMYAHPCSAWMAARPCICQVTVPEVAEEWTCGAFPAMATPGSSLRSTSAPMSTVWATTSF